MRVQRLDDRVDDIAVSAIPAADSDVRFGISGLALDRQLLERTFRVGIAQQGPGVAARRALGEYVNRGVQPDSDCPLIEQLPGAGIDEGAATGGNDADLIVDQTSDETPLPVTKVGLSESFVYFGRGEAGGVFDLSIAVDEGQVEPSREAPADGRLTRAHQADEYDRSVEAVPLLHRSGLYSAGKGRAKAPRFTIAMRKPMSRRIALLLIVLALVVGTLFLLSGQASEQPIRTIETDVTAPANAT